MKPIKPKFSNTVKLEIQISDTSKEILIQYAKYTKYSESEIIDRLIGEIAEDDLEFVEWLSKRRNLKRIQKKILSRTEETKKGSDLVVSVEKNEATSKG
jgi:hypothetical protein